MALPVVDLLVTYMEMLAPPRGAPLVSPPGAVVARERLDLSSYLDLYRAVGGPVQWDQRLRMPDHTPLANLLATLMEREIPVTFHSHGGWFRGMAQGIGHRNVEVRTAQYRASFDEAFCLRFAREPRGENETERATDEMSTVHVRPQWLKANSLELSIAQRMSSYAA